MVCDIAFCEKTQAYACVRVGERHNISFDGESVIIHMREGFCQRLFIGNPAYGRIPRIFLRLFGGCRVRAAKAPEVAHPLDGDVEQTVRGVANAERIGKNGSRFFGNFRRLPVTVVDVPNIGALCFRGPEIVIIGRQVHAGIQNIFFRCVIDCHLYERIEINAGLRNRFARPTAARRSYRQDAAQYNAHADFFYMRCPASMLCPNTRRCHFYAFFPDFFKCFHAFHLTTDARKKQPATQNKPLQNSPLSIMIVNVASPIRAYRRRKRKCIRFCRQRSLPQASS